jgi:hypothetical protein
MSLMIVAPAATAARATSAFVVVGVDRLGLGIRGLAPDIEDVGAVPDQREPVVDRRVGVEVAPAVGERVRGHVDHAHHERPELGDEDLGRERRARPELLGRTGVDESGIGVQPDRTLVDLGDPQHQAPRPGKPRPPLRRVDERPAGADAPRLGSDPHRVEVRAPLGVGIVLGADRHDGHADLRAVELGEQTHAIRPRRDRGAPRALGLLDRGVVGLAERARRVL